MDKLPVRIENPCHLKWDDLTPIKDSKDRNCNTCSFEVIDFTKMTNDEIIRYLSERNGKKVCGALIAGEKKSNLKPLQRTLRVWHTRIKSCVRNNQVKAFLLFSIGLLLFNTGCEKDEEEVVVIGDIIPIEETGLTWKTVKKPDEKKLKEVPRPE